MKRLGFLSIWMAASMFAQDPAAPPSNRAAPAGIWVFPDSLGIHEPVLHLHADGAFDMAQEGDDLEKGQGAIFGTWLMMSDTLALTISSSICCQFESGQQLNLIRIQQKSDTLRILFRGDTISLASWKSYLAQWE